MRQQKGQSTVEYILLVTAVVIVVISFTTSHRQGAFQDSLNQMFNKTTQGMVDAAAHLQNQ